MYNHFLILLILIATNFLTVAQNKKECYRKQLSAADTCIFGEGKFTSNYPFKASLSMGGFDGTKLKLPNVKGAITIKDVSGARGKHQSELEGLYCFGEFTSRGDTLIGNVTSQFDKLFLFDISKDLKVDSFTNSITIKIISNAWSNKAAQTLVTSENDRCSIVALPYLVSYDEVFKARHSKETLAFFAYFEVIDEQGQSQFYDANDYLLVGGNYFLP